MADIAVKSLADGQLASSKGTIYTCPAATQTIVKSIHLCNQHSSALSVNIYFKASGGSSRYICKAKSLAASASAEVIPDSDIYLEAADILEGDDGGTGSQVDYVISGVENS